MTRGIITLPAGPPTGMRPDPHPQWTPMADGYGDRGLMSDDRPDMRAAYEAYGKATATSRPQRVWPEDAGVHIGITPHMEGKGDG